MSNKGLCFSNLGKDEEAIGYYDKAISLDPNYSNAWINKGVILSDNRDFETAIRCYQTALGSDPNNILALNNLKSVYSDFTNEYDKAFGIGV